MGAAWYGREHEAYGWSFSPLPDRYALLEDAFQALPLLWGPGSPAFHGGKVIDLPDTTCYPRPLQEKMPILVGGSGERRTLRLVTRYADACNVQGDAATVAHKVAVLHGHCADIGRDPAEIRVTCMGRALVGRDRAEVDQLVEQGRKGATADQYAAATNAATAEEHVGRYRELVEAGAQTAIVSLPNLSVDAIERFAEVITAFPTPDGDEVSCF